MSLYLPQPYFVAGGIPPTILHSDSDLNNIEDGKYYYINSDVPKNSKYSNSILIQMSIPLRGDIIQIELSSLSFIVSYRVFTYYNTQWHEWQSFTFKAV